MFYNWLNEQHKKTAIVDTDVTVQEIDELRDTLLAIRKELDPVLSRYFALYPTKKSPYPVGYCREITDEVFKAYMKSDISKTIEGPQKKIFGIENGLFQNSLQIGDLYVNVSLDSVAGKEMIDIMPLENTNFQQIKNYEDLTQTMQRAWGYEIHPNDVFMPAFFPFLPTKDGKIQYNSIHLATILPVDIRNDFDRTKQYVGFGMDEFLSKRNELEPMQQELFDQSYFNASYHLISSLQNSIHKNRTVR